MSRRAAVIVRVLAALGTAAALSVSVLSAQTPPRREPNQGGALDLASEDPRVALERLKVAPGYEVSLFASEREFPELAKPLAMTFDGRGRLWVLTSPTYPHVKPDQVPDDKLIVLEDTNRDGRADKVSVFADKLYIPTGFALGDGGVYVSQQPNLMFMRDTDGDGKADERRVILHGFGTEDSHHSIHAFQWGPDGALYFQEGTFLHSQVETPYGPVRLENAGVFRYEPRTEKLSVFVSYAFANPWGHVIDGWGQNFVSDASNGNNYWGTAFSGHVEYPRKQRPMREWTLTKVRPTSGSEFVRSRHFPDEAQGNFLYNNVIGFQGIKQYRTVEDGSGFTGIEVEPLLQSADPNFRPVGMEFGPDGALYVIDWFNPLIGHMQYSLRDPRRDVSRGRVWRITAKGRPLATPPVIDGATIAQQLDLLKAYEDRTRYRARLALRDRPAAEVLPALERWIAGLDAAEAGYEHHLLEALWVHEHHDRVNRPLLERLLKAKEFRARAAAVRVLQHWFDRVEGGLALLDAAVRDEAPRVRLEAVRALSFVPSAAAAGTALRVLERPMDYYLEYVLDSTMTTLERHWKPALLSTAPFVDDNPAGLAFLLDRLAPGELARVRRSGPVFDALVSRPGIELATRREALTALAAAKNTSVVRELFATVERLDGRPGGGAPAADLLRILAGLDKATLVAERAAVERLARAGRTDAVREGALATLIQIDGGSDRTLALAGASPRLRTNLLRAAVGLPTAEGAASAALAAPTVAWLRDIAAGTAQSEPPVNGRYVRLTRPGRATVLSVTEVQVFSRGENAALKGTATQSSVPAGGGAGGHAFRANDGGVEASQPAGADPLKGTVAFTGAEQDPWWEVDLGAEMPIDTVALWAAAADTRTGLHLTVLDGARTPVFVRDDLRLTGPTEVVNVGGDLSVPLASAALAALRLFPGREIEALPALTALAKQRVYRQAALAALRRASPETWPAGALPGVADTVMTYLREATLPERTAQPFRETGAYLRTLAARLPEADRTRMIAELDALAVRTIRIEAVNAQMKFDIGRFTVVAGEEVLIELVNKDEMPHNLLVTKEGALETVSLAAEAMAALPDAFARHFIPKTPEVLFAIRLLQPNETVRSVFKAPASPGNYPFVCTVPGHWRTMNGIVEVVRPAPAVSQP